MPQELLAPLFELKLHETTMVHARRLRRGPGAGDHPGRPGGRCRRSAKRLRGEVAQAMAQDIDVQFLGALRAQSDVRLNPRMLETLAQP